MTSVSPAKRRDENNPWNMASSPPVSELHAPDSPQSGVSLRGIMIQEVNVHKLDGVRPARYYLNL